MRRSIAVFSLLMLCAAAGAFAHAPGARAARVPRRSGDSHRRHRFLRHRRKECGRSVCRRGPDRGAPGEENRARGCSLHPAGAGPGFSGPGAAGREPPELRPGDARRGLHHRARRAGRPGRDRRNLRRHLLRRADGEAVDSRQRQGRGAAVPTLRDWPAMAHRGLSDDWSRGPLPNMDFLKREIRTLAAYKINIFSPYFEHTFAYESRRSRPSRRRDDPRRGPRAGRLCRPVPHHRHPRAGVLRPPAQCAQVRAVLRRWARRRMALFSLPATRPRCR
jgi:hypothetical protein